MSYNYFEDWLSKVHTTGPNIETSSVCILHCKMCFRNKINYEKGSKQNNEFLESLRETEVLSLENFEKMLSFFQSVTLCGNYSDPVYWKHLRPALELLNQPKYKHKKMVINTAAHAPNIEWYKETFDIASKQVEWRFGLDGLVANADTYRQGQNTQLILDAMILGASMQKPITWVYIIMKYNKLFVDQAKDIARKNNIKFLQVYSDRNRSSKNREGLKLGNVNLQDKVVTYY